MLMLLCSLCRPTLRKDPSSVRSAKLCSAPPSLYSVTYSSTTVSMSEQLCLLEPALINIQYISISRAVMISRLVSMSHRNAYSMDDYLDTIKTTKRYKERSNKHRTIKYKYVKNRCIHKYIYYICIQAKCSVD